MWYYSAPIFSGRFFASSEKFTTFVMSNIFLTKADDVRRTCGHFLCLYSYSGFVPPCRMVNAPASLCEVLDSGKGEPLFV